MRGGRRRPAPLWIPAFAGMTMEVWGSARVAGVGGPLRVPSGQASTGSGRTDSGSARATDAWGRETPRAAPLPWIPAFAGTTMGVWGSARAAGGGGPPSTGSGRTDAGSAPTTGSRGCVEGGDAPRRAPLDSCLRRNDACGKPFDRLRGERTWEARVRWGVWDAMGWETPRAPALDSRCRGNDDWAMAGRSRGRWLLGWELRVLAEGDDDDASHYEQGPDQHSPGEAFHAPEEDLGEEDGGEGVHREDGGYHYYGGVRDGQEHEGDAAARGQAAQRRPHPSAFSRAHVAADVWG